MITPVELLNKKEKITKSFEKVLLLITILKNYKFQLDSPEL